MASPLDPTYGVAFVTFFVATMQVFSGTTHEGALTIFIPAFTEWV
jgi:hypothetical protein